MWGKKRLYTRKMAAIANVDAATIKGSWYTAGASAPVYVRRPPLTTMVRRMPASARDENGPHSKSLISRNALTPSGLFAACERSVNGWGPRLGHIAIMQTESRGKKATITPERGAGMSEIRPYSTPASMNDPAVSPAASRASSVQNKTPHPSASRGVESPGKRAPSISDAVALSITSVA